MKTADEVKAELADVILETRAELQEETEYYWRRWLKEVKTIFDQKLAYLHSLKHRTKTKIIALEYDAANQVKEYNSGRRY
jgi:hypothetical protein